MVTSQGKANELKHIMLATFFAALCKFIFHTLFTRHKVWWHADSMCAQQNEQGTREKHWNAKFGCKKKLNISCTGQFGCRNEDAD